MISWVNPYLRRLVQTASLCFLLVCCISELQAQTWLTVDSISVAGNRKTKERIILRELTFTPGDSLIMASLSDELAENQLRLMNTGLFGEVTLNVKTWDTKTNRIGISIDVVEAWYIYPIPKFDLADRNFNVWWVDYQHSLKRVNFGVTLYYSNFTGRNDYLKIATQLGFTRKLEMQYTYPYVNRSQTVGLSGAVLLTGNRTLNYTTSEDKQVFHQRAAGDDLLQRLRLKLGTIYRPALIWTYTAEIGYHRYRIDTLISENLNPDFFLGATTQRFISFEMDAALDTRDVIPYPQKGFFGYVHMLKEGIGIWDDLNQLYLRVSLNPYFKLSERWSGGLGLNGRVAFIRKKMPFYNSRALGYSNDYLRGYEFYVVDALDYGFTKIDFRFNFLKRPFDWGKAMPIESLKKMPIELYLNFYNDLGYANNPYYATSNELANELLWGFGVGLDILVYYNKLIQIQVSRNKKDEWGVFLHWSLSL